jgi:putative oxidoreductase
MIQSFVAFVGRALLSIIFISSALHKIFDWRNTLTLVTQTTTDWLALNVGTGTLQNLIEMSMSHIPLLLTLAVIFELLGGLLVFFGLWTRLGALLLILFLIPTTLLFHHFWQLKEPERELQMINFMKNVSIAGGLLFLLAVGKCGRSTSPRAPEL